MDAQQMRTSVSHEINVDDFGKKDLIKGRSIFLMITDNFYVTFHRKTLPLQ